MIQSLDLFLESTKRFCSRLLARIFQTELFWVPLCSFCVPSLGPVFKAVSDLLLQKRQAFCACKQKWGSKNSPMHKTYGTWYGRTDLQLACALEIHGLLPKDHLALIFYSKHSHDYQVEHILWPLIAQLTWFGTVDLGVCVDYLVGWPPNMEWWAIFSLVDWPTRALQIHFFPGFWKPV